MTPSKVENQGLTVRQFEIVLPTCSHMLTTSQKGTPSSDLQTLLRSLS